jgi:hypothetical protein
VFRWSLLGTIENTQIVEPLLGFLSQSEMQALLKTMDNSWSGRRDHLLFLFL